MATRKADSLHDMPAIEQPMLTRPFVIRRVIKELHDTFSLELAPQKGSPPLGYKPGQFNMLYVYGVGEVPISISGDPGETGILVHTTREVGTVTRAMRRLTVGDYLGVRGPYGTSWPIDEAAGNDIVIITGGIGLAPLRPLVYHVLRNREKFGQVVILYGARSPQDILYKKQLEKWRSRFDLEVHLTVDRASGAWRGNVGVVTKFIGRLPFDPMSCTAFVCGPEIMMRFTILELQRRGVADNHVHISMERNMKCGIGLCGHCQLGGSFVCKDGPVYNYDRMKHVFTKREM